MKTLAFLWICLLFTTAGQAMTIFVDADAAGANNGTSWADAYNHLQDALADANSTAKPVEIRVAQGIYTPAEPSGDRMATFQLITGVAIRGGYAGFGASEPDARDVDAYQAILSGDLNGDDDGFANNTENSFHVVAGSDTDQTAILDGFTITAGNADGSGPWDPNSQGGGMYNYQGSPTVSNCTFRGNSARWGGGMFNWHSSPTVTDCTFTGNATTALWDTGMGGGVYNYESSEPTLTNCTFSGNSADWGGGMANDFSMATVTGCTFSDNCAHWCGGGTFNGFSSPTLANCTFTGNSARSGGGMANNASSPTLTGCEFSINTATEDGGAMYSHSAGNPTVTRSTFSANSAVDCGGAICSQDMTNTSVTNCIFGGNTAEYGGAVMNDNSTSVVKHCTFNGNSANNGNTVACDSSEQSEPSNVQISNSILWDDSSGIFNNDSSTITITYSSVQDEDPNDASVYPGTGNIDDYPLFVDPASGDYHLLSGSPCIDAGDNSVVEPNSTDLAGNPRIIDGDEDGEAIVDMGAYEFLPPIEADLWMLPGVINRRSRMRYVNAVVHLPEGIKRNDINRDERLVLYPGQIQADRQYILGGRGRGAVRMLAFFDKNRFIAEAGGNGEVKVDVVGRLKTGQYFCGTDTVRIIRRGRGRPYRR